MPRERQPKSHWRQYPPDDIEGWIGEIRARLHELAEAIALLQAEFSTAPTPSSVPQGVLLVAQIIAHTGVTVALIAAYTVLTLTGHDANAILAALGGYLGGGAVQKVAGQQK